VVSRTTRQRIAANRLWHNNTALLRDRTKGDAMKLIPDPPEDRAEKERWYEGAQMVDKINAARAQTGEEPLKVDWDHAPESVRRDLQEARRREEAEEAARIDEKTRALELESARLQGQLDGLEGKRR
jgi:hypothetical protein